VYQLKIDKNNDPAAAPLRGLCDSGRITYDCYQAVTSFPCLDRRSFGNYFLRLAVAVVSAAVPYLADPVDPFHFPNLTLLFCALHGVSLGAPVPLSSAIQSVLGKPLPTLACL
jgi:hypothetical protein